ncbi:hypothetical protein [Campylobacter hominis]|uniref:Uncharacterized protein n=1 Tax=Campylobacter hominis (strain ATCC BAA-381 / DSM 21671 / CCUG 45161 / LMG 19568 / NCTC 13146 / CH001A) TaxID=360107 RepID=A7I3N5_CAMHC|nr:hypothetical protein [Campylobacter hominis]ABS51960.1 hypothetical protein CHAB381_1603 [Campylobacter hominis ATCC BAA-381]SUW85638.1 Uncharacterised protein [Campylobacter hominis]
MENNEKEFLVCPFCGQEDKNTVLLCVEVVKPKYIMVKNGLAYF